MKTQPSQDKNLSNVKPLTQFAFRPPTARQVSLVDDFNNWDTMASPMHKGPGGVWQLKLGRLSARHRRATGESNLCAKPLEPEKLQKT